nr:hypothetical protein [Candidatus Levybacteria bacterium]
MEREVNILGRKLRINIEFSKNTKRLVDTKPEKISLESGQPPEIKNYGDGRGSGLYGPFWEDFFNRS